MSEGTRYLRWRRAIKMPIWVLDQHWYTFLGRLYLGQNYLDSKR